MRELTCTVGATPAGSHAWRRGEGSHGCGQPAVIVILTEQEVLHAGDVEENILTAYPVCADHAPEEVHEARCSMHEDDFLVLELPTTNRTNA